MNKDNNLKNIVLTGMSGAGKTTIGKYISSKLNMKFVDTDDIIVTNMEKTIDQIFSKYGEEYFRVLENEVITKLKGKRNMVITTGGGVVLNKLNIEMLKENGNIFFLEAGIDTLVNNIRTFPFSKEQRPLLDYNALDKSIRKIYNKRKELYLSSTDYIIQVDNKSIENIGDEIIYIFKQLYPCSYF